MRYLLAGTIITAILTTAILMIFSSTETAFAVKGSDIMEGSLFNLQNVTNGKPEWLVGGVFTMHHLNSVPSVNATFYMIKPDGTSPHEHRISNFKLIGKPMIKENSTTFNGTSTVTMKDGPVNQVPISIKLIRDSVLSIWLDPSKTKGHFGNTVIYGTEHLLCVEEPQDCK
jgi:hypothetical protein